MKPSEDEVYARLKVLMYVVVHALATPRPMLNEYFAKWSEKERSDFDDACKQHAESNATKMQMAGLWEYASPSEKAFLQSFGSQMDEYAHKAATWRMECAGTLMWALGFLNRFPVLDEQINPDLMKSVTAKRFGLFRKRPRLRPQNEISARRDLIELWHWRVRTRRLIEEGKPFEADENMKRVGIASFDDIVRFSAKAAHAKGDLPELKDDDFVFLGKSFRTLPTEEYQMATSIIMERHYALNWLCGMAQENRWDETPTDT